MSITPYSRLTISVKLDNQPSKCSRNSNLYVLHLVLKIQTFMFFIWSWRIQTCQNSTIIKQKEPTYRRVVTWASSAPRDPNKHTSVAYVQWAWAYLIPWSLASLNHIYPCSICSQYNKAHNIDSYFAKSHISLLICVCV